MSQGQAQRRRHYQDWGTYLLIGSVGWALNDWLGIPSIVSWFGMVLYVVGMYIINQTVKRPPLGPSMLPDLIALLVLSIIALVPTVLLAGNLQYMLPSLWLLWGWWCLLRSVNT